MKHIITVILLSALYISSNGQHINYARFNMGPKMESFRASVSGNLRVLPHVDASAGVYAGKTITDHFGIEFGLIRNDYSARFEIDYFDPNTKQDETYFIGYVYPSMTTYQLAILPVYTRYINDKMAWFAMAGIQMMLSRKLSREGTDIIEEYLTDNQGNVISSYEMITYGNSKEAGIFLLRGDLGLRYSLSDFMSLDAAIQIRGSTLPLSSFFVEYEDEQMYKRQVKLSTNGLGAALNIGFKFNFN